MAHGYRAIYIQCVHARTSRGELVACTERHFVQLKQGKVTNKARTGGQFGLSCPWSSTGYLSTKEELSSVLSSFIVVLLVYIQ